jgi:hypothetical protein
MDLGKGDWAWVLRQSRVSLVGVEMYRERYSTNSRPKLLVPPAWPEWQHCAAYNREDHTDTA